MRNIFTKREWGEPIPPHKPSSTVPRPSRDRPAYQSSGYFLIDASENAPGLPVVVQSSRTPFSFEIDTQIPVLTDRDLILLDCKSVREERFAWYYRMDKGRRIAVVSAVIVSAVAAAVGGTVVLDRAMKNAEVIRQ